MERQVTTQAKQCAHCKRTLTADNFNVSKITSDGLQSWCKKCTNEYQALDVLFKRQCKGGAKVCKRCGQIKARTDFPNDPYHKDGKLRICNECIDEINGKNAAQPEQQQAVQPTLFDKPLDAYSVQELIDELKRRGYEGTLKKTETLTI